MSVVSDSVQPHTRQPTRLPCPWDSPGKNTRVGCHFLLQCMKVKSESEVAQSCPTLSNPMDSSLPGFSVHGIFQARVLKWVASAFSGPSLHRYPNSSQVGWTQGETAESTVLHRLHKLLLLSGHYLHLHLFHESNNLCFALIYHKVVERTNNRCRSALLIINHSDLLLRCTCCLSLPFHRWQHPTHLLLSF